MQRSELGIEEFVCDRSVTLTSLLASAPPTAETSLLLTLVASKVARLEPDA
ncbi:MAG TPA: hypothetical protein V6C90_27010 [Coleofasciculaceae cyanobacterium]